MKLTIVPSDNNVGINEQFFADLDLSSCNIPANIHALQWYETEGEIEFVNNPDRTKPQNEIITTLPAWADTCVLKWNEAKVAYDAFVSASIESQPITQGTQTL